MFTTLGKNIIFLTINPWYTFKELLRNYKARKQWKKHNGDREFNPKMSVIIPAWNEEVGVVKTIKSILANTYKNKEIVVVNDESTDNTDAVIKQFLATLPDDQAKSINYISQPNGGKGVALNKGITNATGDIIVTCDADSAFLPDALTNLSKYYLDEQMMAVVGKVEVDIKANRTWVGLLQALEYQFGFYNKRGHAVMGAEYIFGGACASFRAEVFEKIGLFDDQNRTEDIEMSMRCRAAGMHCTYAEDVLSITEGASDLPGLISQRVRWKKRKIRYIQKIQVFVFLT
jgi:cellulose synthase/poly-beta-1,6-N-acetylglucosamine synthase-like glycosyltransferase